MPAPQVGDEIGPLDVEAVAHGGHCVGRWEGQVVFVRHALPGERVRASVTDVARRFLRADAVAVLEASPDRVRPTCEIAGPAGCGGCDLQHASPQAQRTWKTAVLAQQLARLAGIAWDGEVEAVPGSADGFGWRTRVRYFADDAGVWGLRAHRSHRVVALPQAGCRLAVSGLERPNVPGSPGAEVTLVQGFEGAVVPSRDELLRKVGEREFRVALDGFWQVHPAAAGLLSEVVLGALDPRTGEVAVDLYCGVGLFAAGLVEAGACVIGIEGDATAVALARSNVPEATFRAGDVTRTLRRLPPRLDLAVIDPPRSGAGHAVIADVLGRRPRAVAYVACDPATLARDLGYARESGYRCEWVRAFDLFPNTHHIESVALLVPDPG